MFRVSGQIVDQVIAASRTSREAIRMLLKKKHLTIHLITLHHRSLGELRPL
jgi:hypothetical protein